MKMTIYTWEILIGSGVLIFLFFYLRRGAK